MKCHWSLLICNIVTPERLKVTRLVTWFLEHFALCMQYQRYKIWQIFELNAYHYIYNTLSIFRKNNILLSYNWIILLSITFLLFSWLVVNRQYIYRQAYDHIHTTLYSYVTNDRLHRFIIKWTCMKWGVLLMQAIFFIALTNIKLIWIKHYLLYSSCFEHYIRTLDIVIVKYYYVDRNLWTVYMSGQSPVIPAAEHSPTLILSLVLHHLKNRGYCN